jgi:hypothetical protein
MNSNPESDPFVARRAPRMATRIRGAWRTERTPAPAAAGHVNQ